MTTLYMTYFFALDLNNNIGINIGNGAWPSYGSLFINNKVISYNL